MVLNDLMKNENFGLFQFLITGKDLLSFANALISETLEQAENKPTIQRQKETYITSEQMAEELQVSKVTLWNWDKKGITKPLRIGKAKRYRLSDLENILTEINK